MTGVDEAIRALLDRADKCRDKGINEADTKALFIEPMLGALGWAVHDVDAVSREYRVYDGTLLDYALKVGDRPRLFVEAKPLLKSLDDKQFIAQTVNYANNEGVVWCVLTNGLKYRVYKSNEPVGMESKLLVEVDLEDARDQSRACDVTEQLSYLRRESIESGQLDAWGEATFIDVRIRSALNGLFANPPSSLISLIASRLGSSLALPREKIKDSLVRIGLGSLPPPPGKAEGHGGPAAGDRWTYEHHFRSKPQNILDLYNKLHERIMALGPDVQRSFSKLYINYSTRRSFVTVQPQKRKVLCYVSLAWEELPERDTSLARDVRSIGHYGMGDTEITLSDATQLDYVLRAVEASYRKAHQ